ncbi:pentatricopeptide repeat-containing protein [Tripterygium wilfordii]|uniref:Pentatricopeptide repeat-containing protein n=1 Tax=Tripterygium wilfordii TaxID=458696 RepID=A0A7J7DK59_TRIWF|nr:pentatricopeptide repeat-containing protein At3g05340-like [Tripterygium wilfordii]KAF5746742.1 pentatricopeptide repeat-containing protein [Tripterygium wilfordii]
MKSKWVFQKLKTHIPSEVSSLISPLKTEITRNPSINTSTFVLNHQDITQLLSICGREGYLRLGTSIHASIMKNHEFFNPETRDNFQDVLIWNSLLAVYAKSRKSTDAVKLFDEMPIKNTVSWNTLISGFLTNGDFEIGFALLKQMLELDFYGLDQATLTIVLSACDTPEFCKVSRMIHGLALLKGYEREITVCNALITSYFKCRCFGPGKQVFDEMLERNVISWTAIISGLAQNQLYENSLHLFVKMCNGYVKPNSLTYLSSLVACSGLQALVEGRQIHGHVWKLGIQSDLCVESALMDMYSKCRSLEDAWRIFESAEELDEVSMTVILAGFAKNGSDEEAIQFFVKMVKMGINIDPKMVSSILGVFGADTSLGIGEQIHSLVIKRNFSSNIFVSNGLINMYSKCGDLVESIKVFIRIPQRNSISWSSMIAAFARHGDGFRALQLYDEMRLEGVEPTDVTFLSLLHACSHVGLVEKGMEFLKCMTEVHRIIPRSEHYACVVDMLGRAGLLSEAKSFIEALPVKPDVLIWQSLLGACSIHGDSELGKYAADQLFVTAPETAAPYILMANIYSLKGRWKERAGTIKKMKEMGVAKVTGTSWIEIEKKVHSFVVEDKMHPEADTIYFVLGGLFRLMVDEGYVMDKRFILYYLDQKEKGEQML